MQISYLNELKTRVRKIYDFISIYVNNDSCFKSTFFILCKYLVNSLFFFL